MNRPSKKFVTIDLTDDQIKLIKETLGVDCKSLEVSPRDIGRLRERPPDEDAKKKKRLVLTSAQQDEIKERLGDSLDSLLLEEDVIVVVYGAPKPPDTDSGTA